VPQRSEGNLAKLMMVDRLLYHEADFGFSLGDAGDFFAGK
jgi:hypothetical protein